MYGPRACGAAHILSIDGPTCRLSSNASLKNGIYDNFTQSSRPDCDDACSCFNSDVRRAAIEDEDTSWLLSTSCEAVEAGYDRDEAARSGRTSTSRKSLSSQDSLAGSGDGHLLHSIFQIVDPAFEDSGVLIRMVAAALQRLVEANESEISSEGTKHVSPFHGFRAPPISLEEYLRRIAHYTKCSPVCFIAAIAYMAALHQKDHALAPCSLNVHRLLLVGSLLATKLFDDKRYSNLFWARVGGVSLQELNSLELQMMHLLDYRLLVSSETARRFIRQLQAGNIMLDTLPADTSVDRKRRSTGGGSSTGSEGPPRSRRCTAGMSVGSEGSKQRSTAAAAASCGTSRKAAPQRRNSAMSVGCVSEGGWQSSRRHGSQDSAGNAAPAEEVNMQSSVRHVSSDAPAGPEVSMGVMHSGSWGQDTSMGSAGISAGDESGESEEEVGAEAGVEQEDRDGEALRVCRNGDGFGLRAGLGSASKPPSFRRVSWADTLRDDGGGDMED